MDDRKRDIFLTFDLEDFRSLRRGTPGEAGEAGAEIARGVDEFLAALPAASRCTFFATGHVGRTQAPLVRRLAELGHEIACHGDEHENVAALERASFRGVLERATKSLQDASGQEVRGFRAPSFSLPADRSWFFEELARAGYRYDSSVVQDLPRAAGRAFDLVETPFGTIAEFPLYRLKLPFAPPIRALGGTYFRFLPQWAVLRILETVETKGYAPIVWLHASDLFFGRPVRSIGEALRRSWTDAVCWPLDELVQRFGRKSVGTKLGRIFSRFRGDNALRTQAIF